MAPTYTSFHCKDDGTQCPRILSGSLARKDGTHHAYATLSQAISPPSRTSQNATSIVYPQKQHSPPQTTRISRLHPRPARYLCQGCPVFWGIDKQDRVVRDLGVLSRGRKLGGGVERLSLLKCMNQPIRQAGANLEALLHLPGIGVSDSVAIDTYLD